MKKYKLSVYIFTRDLRLEDNTALMLALSESELVIPIFIFNPEQIDDDNEYKSDNCVQFMCECLDELNQSLKGKKSRLFYFYGDPIVTINKLLSEHKNITSVYMNKDYTPFAVERENNIRKLCIKKKVNFSVREDYVLNGIYEIVNSNEKPYVKFTPFLKASKKKKVEIPRKNSYTNYISSRKSFTGEYKKNIHKFYQKNDNLIVNGGRSNAIKIFKKIEDFNEYNKERDYPAIETTHLSPYLKFNVVSIREVYHFFKRELPKNTKLITQLYWRDFYMSIVYHNPHVIGSNMNNYKIKWNNNKSLFDKWRKGLTGFPIVDAGMRQLNETGWMHNRARMNVANFLVKIMHIDWRIGEKYFAQQLVDYDPANNNGGWQWCASTGTDSQPYFRYFNPWSQSKKFDPDAEYIKRWIPELEDVEPKDIHTWHKSYKNHKEIKYPKPIFDNIQKRIKEMLNMYK